MRNHYIEECKGFDNGQSVCDIKVMFHPSNANMRHLLEDTVIASHAMYQKHSKDIAGTSKYETT